jgi:hypothetical protein
LKFSAGIGDPVLAPAQIGFSKLNSPRKVIGRKTFPIAFIGKNPHSCIAVAPASRSSTLKVPVSFFEGSAIR